MKGKASKLNRFKVSNSRRLRANVTDAETKLWSHLWRIPLEGAHFRRQVPIGPYFADFACHQIGLVIELDGSQHATDDGVVRDGLRTAFLEAQGYQVLRFWNADVLNDIDGVLDTIFAVVQQRQILLAEAIENHPIPAPGADPPDEGKGEES
ncbi:endonuclease domain-containing protein [Rhizobium sp. ARZ01]|uniref:endonuclease domain-containing protein n=1 Tax=Rhizobium sp. ARZ01 TaxID=2769313 RepID=UPI00178250FF|nr:endonuclease domain-containing protein [Rhizobium sp. ARZ01]MBD9371256.1 endonuclease domain-containing protein [Rhizobium sp. ARZ01]